MDWSKMKSYGTIPVRSSVLTPDGAASFPAQLLSAVFRTPNSSRPQLWDCKSAVEAINYARKGQS